MKKRVISLVLCFTLILSLFSTVSFSAGNQRFKDLPEGHWSYNSVMKMVGKGILEGFEDGSFRPDDSVTRSQFAKILVTSLGLPLEQGSKQIFADVSSRNWEYKYVQIAQKFLAGYNQGGKLYFKSDNPAVREDIAAAVVIARGLDKQTPDLSVLDSYADKSEISENLKSYIAIAIKNHIMDGYGNGLFGPKNTLTRAEASELMYKSGILKNDDSNQTQTKDPSKTSTNNSANNYKDGENHSVYNTRMPSIMVGKSEVFLHMTHKYDPSTIAYAKMDGEPSDIPYFKPVEGDEGIKNREYPQFDSTTFKFLSIMMVPQQYYMFDKGELNKSLQGTGYRAEVINDGGHIKILPNLYLGYYDFAWLPTDVIEEYWSGHVSMNQELWKKGNDYVVIGTAYKGGDPLLVSPEVTNLKDLAGSKIGIMNPSYQDEAMLNKILNTVGLATKTAGGNVGIQMASPGFTMNDFMSKDVKAAVTWGMYTSQLQNNMGFKKLIDWNQYGYGENVPNRVLVVRRDILEKHPDIVQKVVQVNYEATQQAINDGEYFKIYNDRYTQWNMEYYNQPRKYIMTQDRVEYQVNSTFFKDVYDYMTKYGFFKVPYKFTELVNTSFQDKIEK